MSNLKPADEAARSIDWLTFDPPERGAEVGRALQEFMMSKPEFDWCFDNVQALSDHITVEIRSVIEALGITVDTINKICLARDASPSQARGLLIHALRALGGYEIPDDLGFMERAFARMMMGTPASTTKH